MISSLRTLLLASAIAMCLFAGCKSKDTGQTDVKIDAAKSAQDQEAQIKEVQNNPNIPANQKQAIIGRIRGNQATGQARQGTTLK